MELNELDRSGSLNWLHLGFVAVRCPPGDRTSLITGWEEATLFVLPQSSLCCLFLLSVSRQRHGWRAFFKKSGVKPGVSWLGTWQFQCLCFCVPAQLKGGRTVKVSSFPLCWPVNGIKQSWREGRGLFIVTAVQRDAGSKGWSYGNQQTNGWPEYHFKKIHPPPPLICSCLHCEHQWYPFISTPDWNPEITQKRGETWPEEKQITA